jgi:large subunit ribosomal protein L2
MALRQYNPVTASLRGTVLINRSELWKGKPVKALTEGKHSTGGRNNHGHITSRFMGGGHKQSYRYVDFKRRKFDVPATVERLEYDPNRTASLLTSSRRSGCARAIPWCRVSALISSRATRCRWRQFLSAPSSTTSR